MIRYGDNMDLDELAKDLRVSNDSIPDGVLKTLAAHYTHPLLIELKAGENIYNQGRVLYKTTAEAMPFTILCADKGLDSLINNQGVDSSSCNELKRIIQSGRRYDDFKQLQEELYGFSETIGSHTYMAHPEMVDGVYAGAIWTNLKTESPDIGKSPGIKICTYQLE